jgi:hypothetical protein
MINFDFMQFDQTNLWFFVLSAIGLVRERRILPFLIVILGNLIHGSLGAVILASFIFWHRMDLPAPKWVQLKDATGFFFVTMASVSPVPFQNFAIGIGVMLLSLSFDSGGLGVIPPLLLLRQYVPHPPELENLMGMAGIYWIAAEALRFAKSDKTPAIRAAIESLASLGILYGLRDILLPVSDDSILIAVASVLIVFALSLTLVVSFRAVGFWRFYRKTKRNLSTAFTFGNRFISSDTPWDREAAHEDHAQIENSFDRIFILVLVPLTLLGLVWVISRGGVN